MTRRNVIGIAIAMIISTLAIAPVSAQSFYVNPYTAPYGSPYGNPYYNNYDYRGYAPYGAYGYHRHHSTARNVAIGAGVGAGVGALVGLLASHHGHRYY